MYKKSLILFTVLLSSNFSQAAGVALGTTRIIYPIESKQVTVKISNSDKENNFLVQNWITNSQGEKDKNLLITPPLFVMKAGADNLLRVVYTGNKDALPKDRESLFYLYSKVIPSSSENDTDKNMLYIASTTKIKVFMRPRSLDNNDVAGAFKKLKCNVSNNSLKIENPTPYYISLVSLKINNQPLTTKSTMIPPLDSVTIKSQQKGNKLSFASISDYGSFDNYNINCM